MGDIMLELLIKAASLPKRNETIVFDGTGLRVGGGAFNVAWYLRQLGYRPHLVGVYGRREREIIYSEMHDAELTCDGLVEGADVTDMLFALLTHNGHHSVYMRGRLDVELVSKLVGKGDNATVVIIGGSRHRELQRATVEVARTFKGSWLIVNPSYALMEYDAEILRELLQRSNAYVLNVHEARRLHSILGSHVPLQLGDGRSGPVEIVTRGRLGARIRTGSKQYDLEARAIAKQTDVVGAGDAFIAGMVDALLAGHELRDAVSSGLFVSGQVALAGEVRSRIRIGKGMRSEIAPKD